MTRITTLGELDALYGAPNPASLFKELDRLIPEYRAFIEASPFVLVATAGPGGTDCSPRGDPKGFVAIEDDRTLLMPDRRGNNRLDTLRNLIADPRISLLFLVPGVGETIRVNGRAEIDTGDALRARFAMQGKPPASVIRIHIERVYFQCQKALKRSGLWNPDTHVERASLPSAGDILKAVKPDFDGAQYDADYPERLKKTIY